MGVRVGLLLKVVGTEECVCVCVCVCMCIYICIYVIGTEHYVI